MSQQPIILIVDPDDQLRKSLSRQLKTNGAVVVQAADGTAALAILSRQPVTLLITELYLPAGEDDCLVHAIRRNPVHAALRIVAHTHRSQAADREWAMRAGADAYLIKPAREQRLHHVVSRLLALRGIAEAPLASTSPIRRRDSLDAALHGIDDGTLAGASTIVFARGWWDELSPAQRMLYRARAKKARVSLRSDSLLGSHFVEVRGTSRVDGSLSSERPEVPYRR